MTVESQLAIIRIWEQGKRQPPPERNPEAHFNDRFTIPNKEIRLLLARQQGNWKRGIACNPQTRDKPGSPEGMNAVEMPWWIQKTYFRQFVHTTKPVAFNFDGEIAYRLWFLHT